MQKRTGERADDSALFYVYTEERGEVPMNEIFRLAGTIAISNGEANEKIDETTRKASSASDKMGKFFSGVGKIALNVAKVAGTAAVAAVGAVATGVTAMTKEAVENYAEYEQLVGGVETLFKDSADKVMEYANNAYKTAGMSANTYMETVTGFSASLLQSLDGDTAAATETANQAITDMSDNANKMGTDIGMIMNAYQGFAKQNYTMLDNLKLGYGGTKEEMERLLEAAEKIQAEQGNMVNYSIDSYADIINAIHDVQTEMGITGTTAKEASSTIQGSIGQMKGAWQNFMTGMADPNQDFDVLLNNLVDSVVTVADNLVPRIKATLPRIVQGISQVASNLAGHIPGIALTLLPAILSAGRALIGQLSKTFPELLKQLFPDIEGELFDGITSIFSKLPSVFNSFLSIGQSVIPLFLQLVQTVLPLALSYSEALFPVFMQIFSTALPIAFEILQRLLPPLFQIVSVCPQIAEMLIPILDLISPILDLMMPLLDLVIALLEPVMSLLNVALPLVISLADMLLSVLLPILQQLCTFLETYVIPLIQFLLDYVIVPCLNNAMEMITYVVGMIVNIIQGALDVIIGIVEFFVALFTGDWQGMSDAVVKIASGLGELVLGLIKSACFMLVAVLKSFGVDTEALLGKLWTWVKSGFEKAKNLATNIFTTIFTTIKDRINKAVNFVKTGIDKLKGFFNFEWSLPKLKMPHFKIEGEFSLNPPSVPSLGVDWYAKGAVLNDPTAFGMNGNKVMVGGEAGPEAIAPISTLQKYVSDSVASQNAELIEVLYKILAAILAMDGNMGENMREALAGTSLDVDRREFARLVKAVN